MRILTKHLLVAGVIMAFVSGCSSDVSISVTDAGSGSPAVGIRVERYCPVSRAEKIFNPIGATYHPSRLADTKTTDTRGTVTFRKAGSKDTFQFYTRDGQALVVSFGERTIRLSPT